MSSWLGTTLAQSISPIALYTFATIASLYGTIILTIWSVSDSVKFSAFYIGAGVGVGMCVSSFEARTTMTQCRLSPILYSWINVTFRSDPELRALTIASMMTLGYTSYAGAFLSMLEGRAHCVM
jgi:hypothetical protein